MKIPKESPLAVSHFLPEIPYLKREAKIYAHESGYLFVKYSGEPVIQDGFEAEAFTELLKLFPPVEYIYDAEGNDGKRKRRHGIYNIPETDPQKVIAFLNRFGVVGISDLDFRNRVILGRDEVAITALTKLSLEKSKKLYSGKTLKPEFVERLLAIRNGEEVPYHLVERILRDLARSARLYLNLLEDSNFSKSQPFSLTDKNRKRIVSAWNHFGGAFDDSEDPADPRFSLNEEWTYTFGGKKKIPVLDFAEGALSDFSLLLNTHLSLISKSVVTTEGVRRFNLENTGLETAFAAYLVNAFRDQKVKRICMECGSVFLPERVKEENKYCGNSCRKKVTNRNYKAKKRVSASKAGRKTTPKARKEKK